jgi:hypothetical protein
MKLTPTQFKWLQWLNERGGIGHIEKHRVVANGEGSTVGSAICFLKLMCVGAIVPMNGRLVINDYGKRLLTP